MVAGAGSEELRGAAPSAAEWVCAWAQRAPLGSAGHAGLLAGCSSWLPTGGAALEGVWQAAVRGIDALPELKLAAAALSR